MSYHHNLFAHISMYWLRTFFIVCVNLVLPDRRRYWRAWGVLRPRHFGGAAVPAWVCRQAPILATYCFDALPLSIILALVVRCFSGSRIRYTCVPYAADTACPPPPTPVVCLLTVSLASRSACLDVRVVGIYGAAGRLLLVRTQTVIMVQLDN